MIIVYTIDKSFTTIDKSFTTIDKSFYLEKSLNTLAITRIDKNCYQIFVKYNIVIFIM